MAKLSILAGATSQTVNVFFQDSSSTTGAGLTGLAYNTSSLTAYYAFPKASAAAITLATLAAVTSAYSSGGFKEIDSTNMPGLYRLDIPNAALAASSGRYVTIMLKGATNMAPCVLEIELTGVDNQDAVRGGMTALPNAAASAVGGLPVAVDTSGRVDVLKVNGTSQTARDLGASVLLSPGTGTGQVNLSAGKVPATLAAADVSGNLTADVQTIKTQTVTCAAGVTVPTSIASPTNITAGTITTVTNLTNAPTAGDLTATMKTSVTTAATAATPAVTVSDKTGFSLSTAGILAIWHQLTSAIVTAGSVGKLIIDYLDAAVTSRLASAGYTAPDNTGIAAIKTQTDKLAFTVANQVDSNVIDWKGSAAPAMTGDSFARLGAPVGASISADVAGVPAALLDGAAGVETGWTLRQALRMFLASLAGLLSGAATTTVVITNPAGTKDRITATVDANGNRSAIVYDKT